MRRQIPSLSRVSIENKNLRVLQNYCRTKPEPKKIAGAVIGGCVTDVQPLIERRLPVFSLGISPLTTWLLGIEGEVISVCGVSVHSGDLVVADDDGFFVINPQKATEGDGLGCTPSRPLCHDARTLRYPEK
jgi:Demethylmenaquinone methyltransferase